ncbi:ABC transporter ATP-binding protein [Georgenia sp. SUBG003]|uniref:ABC transporter permease n=1 Tax=Georgenia sp. SUBG003 TaxID=1497974 RepID=UPI003AB3C54A
MVSGMDVVPGQGIDFGALGTTVLVVLAVYAVAAVLGWGQGLILAHVVQRTGYRLRRQVQAKIDRLSLSHLDSQARGDTLSRVTNDIDNVTQSLQQTLSQLIVSLLTVLGVLGMMFYLSWQLALIALVTVPLSAWLTMTIAKRAQPHFVAQWKSTGDLGGQVEEAFTGHELVTAFNSQDAFTQAFTEENDRLYRASFRAQFISGTINSPVKWALRRNPGSLTQSGEDLVRKGHRILTTAEPACQPDPRYGRQMASGAHHEPEQATSFRPGRDRRRDDVSRRT